MNNNTYNDYHNEIRRDIAKEFGLEAGGYAPAPKMMPITVAQRINAKYPPSEGGARWGSLNPKALIIAKRYHSLFVK